MIRHICMLASAALVVTGCGALGPRRTRPISMEMTTPGGNWRLEGIQSATLELVGWRVRIVDSKVDPNMRAPVLERLVVEIVNTSVGSALVLEPNENTLSGVGGRGIFLGPHERVVLNRDKSYLLVYDPGIRGEPLLYPFSLNITVFRGLQFQDPQTVSIKLY